MPLNNFVLLRIPEEEDKVGDIIIPDTIRQPKQEYLEVVAVGEQVRNINVGDKVFAFLTSRGENEKVYKRYVPIYVDGVEYAEIRSLEIRGIKL